MPHALMAAALCATLLSLPNAAVADRVTTRDEFIGLVQQRSLTTVGVSLSVQPDGRIGGRAFGRDVQGSWDWQSGWFCRTLGWGQREWPLNCQLVTRDGNKLTFTSDKGNGDSATLTIR